MNDIIIDDKLHLEVLGIALTKEIDLTVSGDKEFIMVPMTYGQADKLVYALTKELEKVRDLNRMWGMSDD